MLTDCGALSYLVSDGLERNILERCRVTKTSLKLQRETGNQFGFLSRILAGGSQRVLFLSADVKSCFSMSNSISQLESRWK